MSIVGNVVNGLRLMRLTMRTENIAKRLTDYYKVTQHNHESLTQLQAFIDNLETDLKLNDEEIFNAIIHAYVTKNSQYPAKFDTYIAMQYFKKNEPKQEEVKAQNPQWFTQKLSELEKHIERIALVKLQLTKNLKAIKNQTEEHLWIDRDFLDPAQETLRASLAQIQDIENRMLVLKATYQDHLG